MLCIRDRELRPYSVRGGGFLTKHPESVQLSLSLKRQSIIFARLKNPNYDLASKLSGLPFKAFECTTAGRKSKNHSGYVANTRVQTLISPGSVLRRTY